MNASPAATMADATKLHDEGRLDDAVDALAEAAERFPNYGPILAMLLPDAAATLRWDLAADTARRAVALEESRPPGATFPAIMPFTALTLDLHPRYQRRLAEQFVRRTHPPAAPRPHERRHDGPLRIGYLSADIRNHPVMHLGAALFEHHDRTRFEVSCFSTGPPDDSDHRRRVIAAADHFVELHDISDAEATRLLHAARLDVLVDLSGHTRFSRFGLLASRPAPTQLHYLGYPGSTGASFVDAYVADPIVAPDPSHFTETLLHLPRCYQINDPLASLEEPAPTRNELGLPDEGLVLGAFSSTYKLEPVIIERWARILRLLPDAVLWLLDPGPGPARVIRDAFAPHVGPDRIVFAPRLARPDHLRRLRVADLALDTYVVGGHTTTSDALRAGVPVVTCPRDPMISRVSASLLHEVGLDDLVVADLDAYEHLVVALGRDRRRLAAVRQRLHHGLPDSRAFDPADAVNTFEDLLVSTRERTKIHVDA